MHKRQAKKIPYQCCLILAFCYLSPATLSAQTTKDTTHFQNTILPLAFYLPETGFALGGIGIATFRFKNAPLESRPSQFLYSAAYTFKNQILLFVPYELYLKEEAYRITGELGFYKYFYNYFGLGPDSRLEDRETYDVIFPRLEAVFSRRISPNIYVGLGYKFDYFNIQAIQSQGLLDTDRPIGVKGGAKSNFLLTALIDNRDNIFSSAKGIYLEAAYEISRFGWGSDYSYEKWRLDARHFQPISKKTVLASHVFMAYASDKAPFFDLPYLSTTRLGRGFSDRRLIDYKLINIQTEYRFPVYRRFGGVAFLSVGSLARKWQALSVEQAKAAYGFGVRYTLNEKEKTKIRLDVGFTKEEVNFYLTLNEAF